MNGNTQCETWTPFYVIVLRSAFAKRNLEDGFAYRQAVRWALAKLRACK